MSLLKCDFSISPLFITAFQLLVILTDLKFDTSSVLGMYRRPFSSRIYVRRSDEDKVLAIHRQDAQGADTAVRGGDAHPTGPRYARTIVEKHHPARHHEFYIKLP